jgi:hypothetical protein
MFRIEASPEQSLTGIFLKNIAIYQKLMKLPPSVTAEIAAR